ncbi:GNAT family N-acetyltransferase [Rhodococcus sp. IEGM 1379]|uniref:GNAT family N-acetyltransferase n=1 Tax=Rhodococcus sp. IEGM 1379 TaxID=3047086 RepID=UPI0024B67788|nr:GNAT family N-acetyltransferase [Rhodococcus sp. IEGM 1379]MDI9916172.1 GNAT family N-acetyltransferase [Rhodococcus sp. IEGM 1379]
MTISIGSRVVLRYKLPPGYSHPMTDVIGVLESTDPITVRRSDGRVVTVSSDQVIALKALAARPIRIGDIRNLEVAAAAGSRGVEQARIDGWLLRVGHSPGSTDSAIPLGEPGSTASRTAETLAGIRAWFADRGRPTTLLLPDRLGTAPPAWLSGGEGIMFAADLDNLPPTPQQSTTTLDVTSDPVAAVAHGMVGSDDTMVLATGRASVTDAPDNRRWVGLTDIDVTDQHRRHGIGALICTDLIAWGRTLGATHAYVAVPENNVAGLATAHALGFVEHHRYRYASAPVGS